MSDGSSSEGGSRTDSNPPSAKPQNTPATTRLLASKITVGQAVITVAIAAAIVVLVVLAVGPTRTQSPGFGIHQPEYARGLITLIFSGGTMLIAVLLVLYSIMSAEDGHEARFAQGKEVLTVLIGVFGTILGFYFGKADSGPSAQPQPQPSEAVIGPEVPGGQAQEPSGPSAPAPTPTPKDPNVGAIGRPLDMRKQADRASSRSGVPFATSPVRPPDASSSDGSPVDDAVMYAHFIDLGQANATLLEFDCGAMLIDAGAVDRAGEQRLVGYLTEFFDRRIDLDRTLASIIVTHNHIDHTRALQAVADNFTVQHYVDNGQVDGAIGTGNPRWIRTVATGRGIEVREVLEDDVRSLHPPQGLADVSIDPVECETCDPRIVVLSGQLPDGTGMSAREFGNKNNHSIVIRVDFGESSFLFTGDQEEAGIARVLEQFHGTDLLDVDVYEVGHHGSHNATTDELLSAMTPEIAIISCGRWTDGRSEAGNPFTTWKYGHPRAETVDRLLSVLTRRRSEPLSVRVFDAPRESRRVTIRKALYATGWEGNISVRATSTGRFLVRTNL